MLYLFGASTKLKHSLLHRSLSLTQNGEDQNGPTLYLIKTFTFTQLEKLSFFLAKYSVPTAAIGKRGTARIHLPTDLSKPYPEGHFLKLRYR